MPVAEVPGADDQVARHAGPRAGRPLLGGGGSATPGGAGARMKERAEPRQRSPRRRLIQRPAERCQQQGDARRAAAATAHPRERGGQSACCSAGGRQPRGEGQHATCTVRRCYGPFPLSSSSSEQATGRHDPEGSFSAAAAHGSSLRPPAACNPASCLAVPQPAPRLTHLRRRRAGAARGGGGGGVEPAGGWRARGAVPEPCDPTGKGTLFLPLLPLLAQLCQCREHHVLFPAALPIPSAASLPALT